MADINQFVLSALYKQPSDNSIQVGANGLAEFKEVYKGNYTQCMQVCEDLYSLSTVKYSDFNPGIKYEEYPHPNPPRKCEWVLRQANVQELEAGDHALLNVTWEAKQLSSDEGDPWKFKWSLSWQSQNMDVYAYCANPENHISSGAAAADLKSQRTAIEGCLELPANMNDAKAKKLFRNSFNKFEQLNANEQKILDKKLQGKNPIMHYPVITVTQTLEGIKQQDVSGKLSEAIMNADHIYDMSNDCPFKAVLSGYEWLCGGSNSEVQEQSTSEPKTYNLIVTTQYTGALSIDTDFYGEKPNRWEFGQM